MMMASVSDLPAFPDLKCAVDCSPSDLWSLKCWGNRVDELSKSVLSLKESFTNYHTSGKAHSEVAITVGQTLGRAATLFGDDGAQSELLTKAADCFNRIECYRDMMLLNQTTTMTTQSLDEITREFEQTKALGKLLQDSQLTMQANWDKFASCRHVSHLAEPSQLHRLARDTFDAKYRYMLMLANYADAVKKSLTEKRLIVLQKIIDHMLAQYSFFNFGYQVLHDMEPFINDLFGKIQTQTSEVEEMLKRDHAERLRVSHEIKQLYETDLLAYPLHLHTDSIPQSGQLKSSGSQSKSSGQTGIDVSATVQNFTGNIKQGLQKLFHGGKKSASANVSEYEIINSPTRRSPPRRSEEENVDPKIAPRSADNSPLPFRRRTIPIKKQTSRPHLKTAQLSVGQLTEESSASSIENINGSSENVELNTETAENTVAGVVNLADKETKDEHSDEQSTGDGCATTNSQGIIHSDGLGFVESEEEEQDTRIDDKLNASCQTLQDVQLIIPVSDNAQDMDKSFIDQSEEQNVQIHVHSTEQVSQADQDVSETADDIETAKVLMQGYLRLHHKVQGRSKWPPVFCSIVLQNDSWLMMALSDGRTNPVELDNLLLCAVKPCLPSEVDRNYCFQLISPRTERYFQAFTAANLQQWMSALQEAITSAIGSRQFRLQPSEQSEAQDLVKNASERIHAVPGNSVCADCTAEDPEWASINLGVVICIECSGVHRSLGVHISKVRSLVLDSWDEGSVQFMESHGNARINAYYEAKLGTEPFDSLPRPTATTNTYERQAFIRMKYVDRNFVQDPVMNVTDLDEAVGSSGMRHTSSGGQQQDDDSQRKATKRKEPGRQFSNRLLNVLGGANSLMDMENELLWEDETDFSVPQRSFSSSRLIVSASSQEDLTDSL